jgi:hypothetical protein
MAAREAEPDTFPQFPMPPPEPTLRYSIPRQLVIAKGDSLGSVFDLIVETLRHAGFDMWSVYGAGNDGFAVVCRLEHIGNDGRRAEPPFSTEPPRYRFNPLRFLKDLVLASPGHYRVIVLLFQPRVLHRYGQAPTEKEVTVLLRTGASDLPEAWRRQSAALLRAEALIYEFYRPDQHSEPRAVTTEQSRYTAVQHLAGAGLWAKEELP